MDTIFISELRVDALIGIYAWEHTIPQTLEMNIELAIDAARSARSGKIEDTIDYAAVVARVREIVAREHFSLLERLAEEVTVTVMAEFTVPWMRISIAKLGALPGVRKLGVTVERGTRR